MTALAWPQASQAHCSGVQTITRSTRGKPAGSSCRPGMWAFLWLFLRRWQRLPLALRLDFGVAHSWLQLQQLELRIAEFLAARSVLLDPLQAQSLFQDLDLQFGPGKFLLQVDDLLGFG